MFTEINYAVESCFKISYCVSSTRFNGCSKCELGYALKFDINSNKPIVDECIPAPENC